MHVKPKPNMSMEELLNDGMVASYFPFLGVSTTNFGRGLWSHKLPKLVKARSKLLNETFKG